MDKSIVSGIRDNKPKGTLRGDCAAVGCNQDEVGLVHLIVETGFGVIEFDAVVVLRDVSRLRKHI